MAHTPGPWSALNYDIEGKRELGDDGLRFWDVLADGPYRGAVCTVHSALNISGISIKERDANAQLIASAPDLLAALEGTIGALEQDLDAGRDSADADWEGLAFQRLEAARAAIAKAKGEA